MLRKFKDIAAKTLPYTISIICLLFAIRIYQGISEPAEYFTRKVKFGYYFKGLFYDIYATLLISTISIICQLVVSFITKKSTLILHHFLAIILLITCFATTIYYLKSGQLLGQEVFHLSLKEITIAANPKENLSFTTIFLFILVLIIYFSFGKLFKKTTLKIPFWIQTIAFLFSIFFYPFKNPENSNSVSNMVACNKAMHFLSNSERYLFIEKENLGTFTPNTFAKISDNFFPDAKNKTAVYPLLHELPEISNLSNELNTSKKGPPNIVVLIVESLGSSMVGENADRTGHVMPFLDSLATKSLFFPNFLSTCERTHNVLPASLCSVPNAPEGKLFQRDNFPAHWSIISLLQKHYYSRFYCGVGLDYCDMQGFLNYHQTDYLVKNWQAPFTKKFSQRENPWGYPDDQIFRKSFVDESKVQTKKARLDVFLTITSHDPFVYPNEEKYIQKLKNILSRNKTQNGFEKDIQNTKNRLREYAAYTYVDESLEKYFSKEKKKPDFDNTIYLIFGDHGNHISLNSEIELFKTPLFIYSPLVKKAKQCNVVCSQLDIAPSLINYLRLSFPSLNLPKTVPFIGQELNFSPIYKCNRTLPFITISCENDYLLQGNYLISKSNLFKLDKNLKQIFVKNSIKEKELRDELFAIKKLLAYLYNQEKIIPNSIYNQYVNRINYKKSYFFNKKIYSTKDFTTKFINVGADQIISGKTNSIKISLKAEFFMNKSSDLTKLPSLTIDLKNQRKDSSELVLWTTSKPYFNKSFKPNNWNEVGYTFFIRKDVLTKLIAENKLSFYLLNELKSKRKLRNVQLEMATN